MIIADGNLPRRVRALAPGRTQSHRPSRCHARAAQRAGTHRMRGAYGTRTHSIWSVIAPADGTRAATLGSGDFGTSPLCLGSSRASCCLPVSDEVGSRTQSTMAGR